LDEAFNNRRADLTNSQITPEALRFWAYILLCF